MVLRRQRTVKRQRAGGACRYSYLNGYFNERDIQRDVRTARHSPGAQPNHW